MALPIQSIQPALSSPVRLPPQTGPMEQAIARSDPPPMTMITGDVKRTLNQFGTTVGQVRGPTSSSTPTSPPVEFDHGAQPVTQAKSAASGDMFKSSVNLMVHSFDVSVEAGMVSDAVSQFVQSLNTLVKAQ
jgi:hypothetical protein